jgi:hypothetical protein
MVSAWIFVALAGMVALVCGALAWRAVRRPRSGRR